MTAPNLVVLLADQWRGQDQGWLGGAGLPGFQVRPPRGARTSQVRTPHLDRLAAGGAAVAGGLAGSPVCGPSRASLLTGRLPHQHGVVANDLPLSPELDTLATALSAAGYRTGWIGKWHLAGLPRDKWVPPAARPGIGYYAGVDCSHQHVDGHYYIGQGSRDRITFTGYEPRAQTGLALDFLAETDGGPFFLTISYNPPHDPYDSVPAHLRTGYPAERMTVPPNTPDSPAQRELQRLYWSAITAVDTEIGRVVAGLERLGLREDTIVVVTSDHGDLLGAHGLRAKQSPYAEAVRVPMVINGPGVPAYRPDGLLGLTDLAPTLLGLLGLPPIGTYGRDLSDRLRSRRALREELLIGNWVSFDNGYDQGIGEWRGFVTGELTYARRADGRPWLLFDDRADPWQLHDLAADPASAGRVAEADARLTGLLAEAGDAFLPAERLLAELDLVDAWNARESALRGDRARLLPAPGRRPPFEE
ncbi:arylsulfatase A-like enzyme [Nonomuraea thailandensis]|uniref:Arylsulfatase A-like enzyme n=1 Tax=Nonomuraea thailandensis TaxID=1188745 RepID=A0A9X2GJ02_9ACTN|nr:sulfatase-like hydrolase/transferase [Nonomuraea thailandensis]MCP2358444.1 arylsulfatase A-like enzyme [Nonomuraea thailandensis]